MGLLTALLGLKLAKALINGLIKLTFFILMVAFATFYISDYIEKRKLDSVVELPELLPEILPIFPKKDKLCKNQYRINKVKVCSLKPLSGTELEVIGYRTNKTLRIYPQFINKEIDYRFPLSIYVLDLKTLNDGNIFKNKPGKKIVGRYLKTTGEVFVSREMFLDVGKTDLQHELAHYINDNLGYKDEEIDEKLAYSFEKYYNRR